MEQNDSGDGSFGESSVTLHPAVGFYMWMEGPVGSGRFEFGVVLKEGLGVVENHLEDTCPDVQGVGMGVLLSRGDCCAQTEEAVPGLFSEFLSPSQHRLDDQPNHDQVNSP